VNFNWHTLRAYTGCNSLIVEIKRNASIDFAIRYSVKGSEYWDYNDGNNYKVIAN
jgi:Carbohydrate/starch-binding module (family 21)